MNQWRKSSVCSLQILADLADVWGEAGVLAVDVVGNDRTEGWHPKQPTWTGEVRERGDFCWSLLNGKRDFVLGW